MQGAEQSCYKQTTIIRPGFWDSIADISCKFCLSGGTAGHWTEELVPPGTWGMTVFCCSGPTVPKSGLSTVINRVVANRSKLCS